MQMNHLHRILKLMCRLDSAAAISCQLKTSVSIEIPAGT